MIKYNFYGQREDGEFLVQTVSDEGLMLMQVETGLKMPDPIDVADRYFDEKAFEVKYKPKYFHYIETDEKINKIEIPTGENLFKED